MAIETSWAYRVSEHKVPGGAGPEVPGMTWSKCAERDLKTSKVLFVLENSEWPFVISLVIIADIILTDNMHK